MTEIINLTPYEVTLVGNYGKVFARIPASRHVARVETRSKKIGTVEVYGISIDVVAATFGKIQGLPDPEPDTWFVVSFPVLQALAGIRKDVIAPDTTPASVVRDEKGQVLGVKRFQTIR